MYITNIANIEKKFVLFNDNRVLIIQPPVYTLVVTGENNKIIIRCPVHNLILLSIFNHIDSIHWKTGIRNIEYNSHIKTLKLLYKRK